MKLAKVLTVFVVALVLVSGAYAGQGMKLSVGAGYTMSAFEDQDDAAGNIAIDVSLAKQMGDALWAGLEIYYPLGYTFETSFTDPWSGQTAKFEQTLNNYMLGVFGKYFLSDKPYLKAGLGYFMGGYKVESDWGDEDGDIDSAIGFIVGAGAQVTPKVAVEFNYRIVNREDFGMNSWDILVQYGFDLGK